MLYDANLTGLPACTVPIGVGSPRGGSPALPIGGQFLGPRLSDRRLLRIAGILSAALPLPDGRSDR
jgi:Asp-tRNA(Asn)/Glu-tRNA(Gln) amidotransferase A subunit family amidase